MVNNEYPNSLDIKEIEPDSQGLYQHIVDERLNDINSTLVSGLNSCCDISPKSAELLAKSNGASIACGNIGYAYSRLERYMIDTAAKRSGTVVLEKKPENISSDTKPWLSWELSDGGYQSLVIGDPNGGLTKELKAIEDQELHQFDDLIEQLLNGADIAVSSLTYGLEGAEGDYVSVFMDSGLQVKPDDSTNEWLLTSLKSRLPNYKNGDEPRDPLVSREGFYYDESGRTIKILVELKSGPRGIYRGMYFDDSDPVKDIQDFKLGLELDRDRASMEVSANLDIITKPFVYSDTAKSLIEQFETSDLSLSTKLKGIIKASHNERYVNTRYGNSYSELTREIAKFVNDPNRSLGELFTNEDAIDKVLNINIDNIASEPAKVLIELLKQSVSRNETDLRSSIPVFDGVIHMSADSCKDAEVYFMWSVQEGQWQRVTADGIEMLHKNSGGSTAINLDPIEYKGVKIPAGGLFQRHTDDSGSISYAFVRMTSFAFSSEDAEDAYTWQYIESKQNPVNSDPSSTFIDSLKT